MQLTPFHLAIPVTDLSAAEDFYANVLGCGIGRRSSEWIDFNLFGHQLVCHQVASSAANKVDPSNAVDGHDVPIPHFGVVLEMDTWKALRDRLIANELQFIIEPHIRFAGKVGEQATMFFHDPSGNAVEFKAFADIETELFKA
ncbi:MAG: VOC family protein [Gammaproteobacteria bacterium]|jgi:extradiol dioxygenase family protein|nr:VOC family protein [Gammaproteobacteria bacterium]MDG1125061.1 VOC family protein [Pseudomonadales bacterium]MBT3696662.1 VOC family protein [Gammaproteobacteria bacterium]MBT5333910.1 VOC family protein [Gammaproteobacteria bacterium]MBT5680418.1 VOC family protein [Gammaproteobacteria bacterium]